MAGAVAPAGERRIFGRPVSQVVDLAATFTWVVCSTLPFPGVGMVRYALAAYFLSGLFRRTGEIGRATVRSWPLFIIPVLAIISIAWAPSFTDAIYKGVLLALTGVFAIYIATRLTSRQIIGCYFIVELVAGLASLVAYNPELEFQIGIFDQKNYLAIHMFVLFCASITILIERQWPWFMRAAALLGAPVAFTLIESSKSTTTLALAAVATGLFFGHAFVWRAAKRIQHMRLLLVIGAAALVLILAFAVIGVMQVDLYAEFLKANGKDASLTGRTYLWDQAKAVIDQHPWTGLGANGFWRPESGQVRSILEFFWYTDYTQFSFHNSYYENGVAYGYPGMYATMFLAAWCLYRTARIWFMDQSTPNTFFLIVAVAVVIRTNAEIDLAMEFGVTAVLLYIAAVRRLPRKPARSSGPSRDLSIELPDYPPAHPPPQPAKT